MEGEQRRVRSVGQRRERKRTEEQRWQQGRLCSEIARNGNGSGAESEEGRERGSMAPVSLGEKGSFISSSGVGLESLPLPGKSAISTRAPKTRKGQCERRRIYQPRSRGVKRPERSFRDLKQTRVKPPRRRVRRDATDSGDAKEENGAEITAILCSSFQSE